MSYSSEVLADAPLIWLRMGEASGGTATDSSGNARNGTHTGIAAYGVTGALTISGDTNTALTYAGTAGSHSDVTYASWMNSLSAVSVECWVKFTTLPSAGTFFYFWGRASSSNQNYGLSYDSGGHIVSRIRVGIGAGSITSTGTYNDGNWHHVVGTWDGSTMALYVDGASAATPVARTGTLSTNTNNLEVSANFPGSVDEAAVYGTALSSTRITAHYTAAITAPVTPTTPTTVNSAPAQRTPLVPWLTSLDGSLRLPLMAIGPTGAWSDLQPMTRWGDGASGMYEVQWTMPLPAGFEHPLLRRGTLVELMDGPYRVGSPLILSEPVVGSGYDDPWQLVATGIAREVEGDNAFAAFDAGTGTTTSIPSKAVDFAIAQAQGWRIAGRLASVPTVSPDGSTTTDEIQSVGALLTASAAASGGKRWGVNSDNYLFMAADPTTPTYQCTPNAVALGTADDDYATVVWLRFTNSATGLPGLVFSQAANTQQRFARKEYWVNLIGKTSAISTSTAQTWCDGIMARSKGRLGWTNGFTLNSNELLTMGGVPADLTKVLEDVGSGCMLRLQGMWSDLLEFTGQTYLDIVLAEAKLAADGMTIDLSPAGLVARDLASVVEEITGYKDAS